MLHLRARPPQPDKSFHPTRDGALIFEIVWLVLIVRYRGAGG